MKYKLVIRLATAIASVLAIQGCASDTGTENLSDHSGKEPDEQVGIIISALGGFGASCTADSQCVSGLLCNSASHTCRPPGNFGAACGRDFECVSGLLCNSASHTCRPPGDFGAGCNRNIECASNFCSSSHACG
jgi:hypothetical protein